MNLVQTTLTIRDEKKRVAKMSMWSDLDGGWGSYTGSPLLDYIAYQQGIIEQLDKVIRGRITRARLSVDIELPAGIKTVADAFADVEEIAIAVSQNGSVHWTMPTFNHDLFPPGALGFLPDAGTDLDELMYRMLQPTESSGAIDIGPGLSDSRGNFGLGLWSTVKKRFNARSR